MQHHFDLEIRGTRVYFQRAKELVPSKENLSLQLIDQTLDCARELDGIV